MKIDWNKVKEGLTLMDVLKEENKEQQKEIERLNNRIDKAIKLLTDEDYLDNKLDCYSYPKEVIDILKGEDKE